jgi:hypothetical protein
MTEITKQEIITDLYRIADKASEKWEDVRLIIENKGLTDKEHFLIFNAMNSTRSSIIYLKQKIKRGNLK